MLSLNLNTIPSPRETTKGRRWSNDGLFFYRDPIVDDDGEALAHQRRRRMRLQDSMSTVDMGRYAIRGKGRGCRYKRIKGWVACHFLSFGVLSYSLSHSGRVRGATDSKVMSAGVTLGAAMST